MNWPPQSPDFTPVKVFGVRGKRLKEWFNSPVINTKSRPKIATLDGNKCCDIPYGCRNKQVRSVIKSALLQKASVRLFFFWMSSVYFIEMAIYFFCQAEMCW